jgi:hypothetical protein
MKKLFIVSFLFSTITSFASVIDLQFDSNVTANLRKQVMGDFELMQNMGASRESPIHQEIFGKVDGSNYLQWFQQRVKYFGFSSCGGPSAVACVKPQYLNKIWVSGNYTGINHPQIARLMTLYHEARHTEKDKDNWPHAKCPRNFPYRSIWTGKRLAGNYACDSTVYGSYASASVLLNNISKFCESCSEKTKQDAKIYSDDQVKRVVDAASVARLKQDFEI